MKQAEITVEYKDHMGMDVSREPRTCGDTQMTTQQPDALRLANVCSNLTRYSMDAHLIAAELRRQHARITELESQLAQRFDAADMATAAAQGFRDGVASLSANAGEPRNAIDRDALIDAIAQGLHGTWHCTRVWEAWHVGTMSQDDFEPVDESETPTEIADAVLALLAAPPAAQAEGWISVDERLPEPGNPVLLDIGKRDPAGSVTAPAGAGMGHTDGGRNMFYEGRFDGESQREQQARLRWANDMRAAFERHTGNGWFDKDWRTETGLWSSAWHSCLAAQPTTTAQPDSVQEDAARLDWLEQQCEAYGFQDIHEGNRWEIGGAYANVREAIDAERAASKQGATP